MPQGSVRYAIIAMVLIGLGGVVYALSGAAGGRHLSHPLEKFQTGELSALDVSTAGDPVPDAGFLGPDGSEMAFSAFEGRAVLVNYWATWCGPCERELPSLGALQTARGGPGFEVVALSVDDETDGDYAVERLAELTGGVLAFYHAPDYAPVYGAGVRGFPTTILYGPDGKEVFRLAGEADWSSYEALALIDAALAE